jgi:hypothetical protein
MTNRVSTVQDALHRLEEFGAVVAFLMLRSADADDAMEENVCSGLHEICSDMEEMARGVYETLEGEDVELLELELVDNDEEDEEEDDGDDNDEAESARNFLKRASDTLGELQAEITRIRQLARGPRGNDVQERKRGKHSADRELALRKLRAGTRTLRAAIDKVKKDK